MDVREGNGGGAPDDGAPQPDRRELLKAGAALGGSLPFVSALGALLARAGRRADAGERKPRDYGPLAPVTDPTTGWPLLQLPKGFEYLSFGWAGDPLADGSRTPNWHDGMAVTFAKGPQLILVRNHELRGIGAAFGAASKTPTFDPLAPGGTTNLQFNTLTGKLEGSWASLAGTSTNCAGGLTPWGTWLTCEEATVDPTTPPTAAGKRFTEAHGWVFEVPSLGKANPVPLRRMGRFVHEAVAVDPLTGYVYQTEDAGQSGFYRYKPAVPGQLQRGGTLSMLRVADEDRFDFTNFQGALKVGQEWRTRWVEIDDPEVTATPPVSVFAQGSARGGAFFSRLEGAWYANGRVYFVSTSGGQAREGQIFAFHPATNRLTLVFESPKAAVLDNPDNIAVSPRGGIVVCEDGDLSPQRMHGLTPDGFIFPFAANNVDLRTFKPRNDIPPLDYRGIEWAGACFSPDGRWLFANIQTPGITFAITGPWEKGSL